MNNNVMRICRNPSARNTFIDKFWIVSWKHISMAFPSITVGLTWWQDNLFLPRCHGQPPPRMGWRDITYISIYDANSNNKYVKHINRRQNHRIRGLLSFWKAFSQERWEENKKGSGWICLHPRSKRLGGEKAELAIEFPNMTGYQFPLGFCSHQKNLFVDSVA